MTSSDKQMPPTRPSISTGHGLAFVRMCVCVFFPFAQQKGTRAIRVCLGCRAAGQVVDFPLPGSAKNVQKQNIPLPLLVSSRAGDDKNIK